MSPFLALVNQRIRSLAFDPDQSLLAVAYGTMVALHVYTAKGCGQEPKWDVLELIKGPYNNEGSLINALLFYPTEGGSCKLFIGYTGAGWSVWHNRGSVKRVNPDLSHNVCRIGSAALSPNKRSVAISTLDDTVAVYALEGDGPVLASMKEFHLDNPTDITPIVPVSFTSGGLGLGGTACGNVLIVHSASDKTSLLRHEDGTHIIQAIAVHGENVIIGSATRDGSVSVLKCYGPLVVVPSKPRTDDPVSITAEEALLGWGPSDIKWQASSGAVKLKWRPSINRAARLWVTGS
ncbi:hypothetical protein FRC08_000262 [Ceratobasidium sp. 394]|nr:hypothetical protein FRC08_000262 [Ceratobasidium sp. 394]